jgi:hypothetical protein
MPSGGKPHTAGDRGQRYEIRATGWPKGTQSIIGWTNSRAEAEQMARGVLKAPGCKTAEFEDRQEKTVIVVE